MEERSTVSMNLPEPRFVLDTGGIFYDANGGEENMSRPKEYYYGFVKAMLKKRRILPRTRPQTNILESAYQEALKETNSLPNGSARLQAIHLVIDCGYNYKFAAYEQHYSERKIQEWVTSFVNLVGKKAGY